MAPLTRLIRTTPGKKIEIRIFATYFQYECKLFALKVLPDQSVVIGSGWPGFQVRRVNEQGVSLEGDGAIVNAPHVTFHPPAYWHLRAERSLPVLRGLVWTTPEPDWSFSPWLRFISPRLDTLPFLEPSNTKSGRKRNLLMPVPRKDRSLALFADFVRPEFVNADPEGAKSKYIIAENFVMRLRMGMLQKDLDPAVIFEIRG